MKRRSKPRRTTSPRCSKQRCNRRAVLAGMCKTHATREADRIFSLVTRGYGGCYGAIEFWIGPEFECGGVLQCCHLISRQYRNTRWHKDNVVPMCGAHHRWFDLHPLERENMIRAWLGSGEYDNLRSFALSDADWRETLNQYLTPIPIKESL